MTSRSSTPSFLVSDADDEFDSDAAEALKPEKTTAAQQDLVQASSKNPSILLELDMDGNVKHVSKAWASVVGTDVAKIVNRPIANIILGSEEDKRVFIDATRIMMSDDESYRVRFVVSTNDMISDAEDEEDEDGGHSLEAVLTHDTHSMDSGTNDSSDQASLSSLSTNGEIIELEGQGILIHDSKNLPTHSMWILKPFYVNSLNVELPTRLAESLGFGSEIFSSYLQDLSEMGIINEEELRPPPHVLCRICEQQVPSWWLERHSQLCFHEHKCESDIQLIHDALVEQKRTISAITESLSKQSLGLTEDVPEYKGIPLPKVTPAIEPGKSPVPISRRARSGSFMNTMRFPFKTLALLSELCECAISINPSEFQECSVTYDFSPNTKEAFLHIECSKIPDSSDAAIHLLSSDTQDLATQKVDTVERFNSALIYSQKIKDEVDGLVLHTIRETIKNIRNQNYDIKPSTMRLNSDGMSSDAGSERPQMAHPMPKPAQSNIFTDAYMGTDVLPSPSAHQHRGEMGDSRDRFSPSRSITPGETMSKDASFDSDVFGSLNDLNIRSPVQTPQRRQSPALVQLPTGFHNSPMSSIQRNKRSQGGFESISVSGTPISSPLILAHEGGEAMDKKHSSGEHFLSLSSAGSISKPPLSPLLVAVPSSKSTAPSIKDYEILKPISKGAFGSVYLARRRVTGDYFAIKVLKKSDMIAKNQVTNVKAERAIMMAQSDSPYVARLYSSFQSKEYLFLVMEYLPGGDCSTMVKLLGGLPDEWARQYIAEVIVGVDDLHQKGIVHHDLKPDNLLIDSNGHLKLTDFGLSRMGLIRRQERMSKSSSVSDEVFGQPTTNLTLHGHRQRQDSISTFALTAADSVSASSSPTTSFFDSLMRNDRKSSGSGTGSQSGQLESPQLKPMQRSSSQTSFILPDYESVAPSSSSSGSKNFALFDPDNSAKNKKFVGTPDYLAPETIRGTGENEASDWWSVGCILFEFLFGYPPFHSNSPEKVFENILNGDIDWPNLSPDEEASICSPEAKDLIRKLLTMDPQQRLGANGASEIKNHPYLKSVNWGMVYMTEGSFIPAIEDPESTDYFEKRGAEMNEFPLSTSDEDEGDISGLQPSLTVKTKLSQSNMTTALGSPSAGTASSSPTQKHLSLAIPIHLRERRPSKLVENTSEFGSFQFRNLPALDKANKDVINRIKAEHLEHRNSISSSSSEGHPRSRNYSTSSSSAFKRSSSPSALLRGQSPGRGSFSSHSNVAQTPTSASGEDYYFFEPSTGRSSPSTDSGSPSTRHGKVQTPAYGSRSSRAGLFQRGLSDFSPSSSDTEDTKSSALQRVHKRRQSSKMSEGSNSRVQILDVLLCEPIPILRYSLKKDLESLGCAVVSVTAADELIRRATGEVRFDLILTALKMTKMDVIDIVKLLKHTSSVNSDTPIIALTAYYKEAVNSGYFTDVLEKPVSKKQLKSILEKHCRMKVSRAEEAVSDSESELSGSGSITGTLRDRSK